MNLSRKDLNICCKVDIKIFSLFKGKTNEPHRTERIFFGLKRVELLGIDVCQSYVVVPFQRQNQVPNFRLDQSDPLQLVLARRRAGCQHYEMPVFAEYMKKLGASKSFSHVTLPVMISSVIKKPC